MYAVVEIVNLLLQYWSSVLGKAVLTIVCFVLSFLLYFDLQHSLFLITLAGIPPQEAT